MSLDLHNICSPQHYLAQGNLLSAGIGGAGAETRGGARAGAGGSAGSGAEDGAGAGGEAGLGAGV